jgi:ribose/xylose/arabinose/galactoside ABC-type transport system permease subunit
LTIATGFSIGLFTGFFRVRYAVPSFITTLALFTTLRGLALMITKGFPLSPFPEWYSYLGGGYLLGIPVPAIIFLLAALICHFVLKYTTFGAAIYAVGGNDEAARLSGINVSLVRYLIFAITGALAALSGILLSSRIMSGTPTVAQQWELDAITAVIIGGASFAGGVGTIRGTLLGVFFIGVIVNGMTMLNVDIYFQYIVRGGLILFAVLMNRLRSL